jgi:hypothetical protein
MNTLLRFGRIGDVFGFVILLWHCEQFLHFNRTELLASIRNPVYDRNVIAEVKEQQQCCGDEKQTRPRQLHPFPLSLSTLPDTLEQVARRNPAAPAMEAA